MLVTYVENKHQLQSAKECNLSEVIIGNKKFSRFGVLDIDEFNDLCHMAKELGLKVVFEWDILMVETSFNQITKTFSEINLDVIDVIRVQDQGALNFVLQNTNKKIQYIAESANHNLLALKQYEIYIGDRLDRLVLSIELTDKKLKAYKEELKAQIEFLILGRILLFYTPRNLLSPLRAEKQSMNQTLIASGESEESPHKGFPLIENSHGTFMFHIKHQFLLDQLDALACVDFLRVDLRFDSDFTYLKSIIKVVNKIKPVKEFKEEYAFETIRGFFKVNKSDVLFKKLKNQKVQRQDLNYLGEVIDAQKPSHLIIHLKGKSELSTPIDINFINPEGKEIPVLISEIKNLFGENITKAIPGDYVQIKYNSKIWVKSQAYI